MFVYDAVVVISEVPAAPRKSTKGALLDFASVWRNRTAMAWIGGYTVHTWELAALRAWGVTFLATVIALHGAPKWLPTPTTLFTGAGLLGVLVSVVGNETAERYGRLRIVVFAMGTAAALSVAAGWSAAISAPLAILVVALWNAAVYLDSSALTTGTLQAAGKDRRGITMGLHSMCGYAGGFIGPPLLGLILDLAGRDSVKGWAVAFDHLALITLIGLFTLLRFTAGRGSHYGNQPPHIGD